MGIFASFPSVRSARIMVSRGASVLTLSFARLTICCPTHCEQRDKTSGKCRGYGFVAFADLPAAQRSSE